jgi:hypothetical protein
MAAVCAASNSLLVLAAGRHHRIRVGDVARDRLQAPRHHVERPANVAFDARADGGVIRPEERALGDAAAGHHREHADRAGQRNSEHATERRVHIDDLT